MDILEKVKSLLLESGVSDVSFCTVVDAGFGNMTTAVSIVVKLSNAIVSEITDRPTHTYFHHYRTVNAFIDSCLLKAGLFLEKSGYSYVTVAASQSINNDGWNYSGRYSHKKVACLSGLGTIGKNSLFVHKKYGPAVRLGTLFTNCPYEGGGEAVSMSDICGDCRICVESCPAGAISGIPLTIGNDRSDMFLPDRCSEFMKREFKNIGRGSVCGICIRVCPYFK